MDEHIKREAAIARIKKYAENVYGVDLDSTEQYSADAFADIFCNGLWNAIELIDDIPAADVAPVVHGRWISWEKAGNFVPSPDRHECSVCHDAAQVLVNGFELLSDYCPNCGAKMNGGDSNALN
jgi:hypothetical protein